MPMTPQALLRARFSELAEAFGVTLVVRRQGRKFYFIVTGAWGNVHHFMHGSFPEAWMTSSAGPECTFGLPPKEVERVLGTLQVEPDWLQHQDAAALRLAQLIRKSGDFATLPILADALEEGGCTNDELLSHCREATSHHQTCWVVELLLGPTRQRRGNHAPEEAGGY